MRQIVIPDFDEEEPGPTTQCLFCRQADAVTTSSYGDCPLAACGPCSRRLAAFVARGATAGVLGRMNKIHAAWDGFSELGRWYWSALDHDDEIDSFPARQFLEEMAERICEELAQRRSEARRAREEDCDWS